MIESNESLDIQEIEMSIEEAKEMIALGDALQKLQKNTAFKKLILEEYFEKEAVRLVHLYRDPSTLLDPRNVERVESSMTAIGEFSKFLRRVAQGAHQARASLDQFESELAIARQEEAEE